MRAVGADWEHERKDTKKILPQRRVTGAAVFGARRLAVKAPGEFDALALAQAAERLAGRDPAAVEELGGLHPAVLGEGQQHVEHLRALKVRGRVAQQRADRHSAGLEVALELGAKRSDLVGPVERVDALIEAARGCRRMLERVVV